MPDFADRFRQAGYGTLAFDNRHWGDSEGGTRNEVDPWLQTRDYLDAFNFATTLPEVDDTRIVYWGSSMSGGNAICAAAVNKNLAGVILQVPFVSGESVASIPGVNPGLLVLERGQAVARGRSQEVPILPTSQEDITDGLSRVVLKDASSLEFQEEMRRRGLEWVKNCTTQSLLHTMLHEPMAYIHRISPTPMLMIVADQDTTTQTHLQLQAFEKALQPKRLKILKGQAHFSPYFGVTFEENIKEQIDFLKNLFE